MRGNIDIADVSQQHRSRIIYQIFTSSQLLDEGTPLRSYWYCWTHVIHIHFLNSKNTSQRICHMTGCVLVNKSIVLHFGKYLM